MQFWELEGFHSFLYHRRQNLILIKDGMDYSPGKKTVPQSPALFLIFVNE